MESVIDVVQALPPWAWLLIGLGISVFFLGTTILSRFLGFGPHVIKETETFDYVDGERTRRSVATERQTGRTFWDWMTVLTVSAVIAAAALLFTLSQGRQQREIQEQQAKDAILQAYLDQMTQMMLESKKPIQEWTPDSEEGVAVRARTVTALRRLEGEQNKSIITFLKEAGFVSFGLPGNKEGGALRLDRANLEGIDLAGNNLSGFNLLFAELRKAELHDANFAIANLAFADLGRADLEDADLRDADLILANLRGTNLADANLSGADLLFASLEDTNFSGADFSGANLAGADLKHANLIDTSLTGANLSGANFSGADLKHANLDGANLSGADLEAAMNLTEPQINRTVAGDTATKLPDDIPEPSRWSTSKGSVMWPVTDPSLKASLVALGALDEENRDKVEIPEEVGISGVLVCTVTPDGLAASAGFKAGDVIYSVGKRPVRGPEELQHELDRYEVGNRVWFAMWRSYFQGWKKGTLDTRLGDDGAAN